MLELFSYPFMQRALLSGILISLILGWLGTFIVSRKMSFIGDGIAHASLGGIALAVLVGIAPLPTALIFGILLACILFTIEQKTNIGTDSAIGIIFTSSLALGIMLISLHQGYQPELISYLFGNILAISTHDLVITLVISTIALIALSIWNNKLIFITFDKDGAYLSGISPARYDLALYILTALSIILSVKLVGVILVSALLITPSATAKLIAPSFAAFQKIAITLACMTTCIGLLMSYYLDLPSGAAIILTGSFIFTLTLLGKKMKMIYDKQS